jgi:hypothetical protein
VEFVFSGMEVLIMIYLTLVLCTVLVDGTSNVRSGLANINLGDWSNRMPLFTNNDICFYFLILNAGSVYEQYMNSILVAVYIYFISR